MDQTTSRPKPTDPDYFSKIGKMARGVVKVNRNVLKTDVPTNRPYKNSPHTPIPHETRVSAGKKAAAVNLARDPDFYKKMGQKGGSAPHKIRGFQAMSPEKIREAGARGGAISRKNREAR